MTSSLMTIDVAPIAPEHIESYRRAVHPWEHEQYLRTF